MNNLKLCTLQLPKCPDTCLPYHPTSSNHSLSGQNRHSHLSSSLSSSVFSALTLPSSRSASSSRCAVPPLAVASLRSRMRLAASSVRASWAVSLPGAEELRTRELDEPV